MVRIVLSALAISAAVLAAAKARRGASASVALAGGVLGAAFAVAASLPVTAIPLACLLLHWEAMVVSKTLSLARGRPGSMAFGRGVAFLLFYPGVDPDRAYVPDPSVDRGRGVLRFAAGLAEMLCAFALSTAAERAGILAAGAFPAAWVRVIALLLLLDGFGRTMSGVCRAMGTGADDAFDRPWLSRDLAELWGVRWNKFVGRALFHDVYRPWARRLGPLAASMCAFLASGLLHEVLYVLPAGGVPGRYLAFFGIQGAGVIASSRMPSPVARCVFCWVLVLATVPIFFGGAYPVACPLEKLLA
jgi:hypothetical protein